MKKVFLSLIIFFSLHAFSVEEDLFLKCGSTYQTHYFQIYSFSSGLPAVVTSREKSEVLQAGYCHADDTCITIYDEIFQGYVIDRVSGIAYKRERIRKTKDEYREDEDECWEEYQFDPGLPSGCGAPWTRFKYVETELGSCVKITKSEALNGAKLLYKPKPKIKKKF